MDEIKMIPVDWLYSHPDNPRKELGDLTELTESIKANGVMQNLTVVPAYQVKKVWERRRAAHEMRILRREFSAGDSGNEPGVVYSRASGTLAGSGVAYPGTTDTAL